jgi:hypothetical protein
MLVAFIFMVDNYSYNYFSELQFIKMARSKVSEIHYNEKNYFDKWIMQQNF